MPSMATNQLREQNELQGVWSRFLRLFLSTAAEVRVVGLCLCVSPPRSCQHTCLLARTMQHCIFEDAMEGVHLLQFWRCEM